jgi:hypothetical protein
MPTVIQTLAKIASDVNLQEPKEIEQLLISNNIDEAIATAIMAKDIISLERQLDVSTDIVCFVVQPDDEPEENESEDENTENAKSVINL